MASTRNRNTPGDYKMEQHQYNSKVDYLTHLQYGQPPQSLHPGDGLMGARTCRNTLSYNACDIESSLFGIGANNLVRPNPKITPQIKEVKSLSIYEKKKLFSSEPIPYNKDQRPMILN